MTREEMVSLARIAAGGPNRPSTTCEAEIIEPWGESKTVTVVCEHAVRNPASYDPPEWVLDAIRVAHLHGRSEGWRRGHDAAAGLYPEAG